MEKSSQFTFEECFNPSLSRKEIDNLCLMDSLCFPEPINYNYPEMKGFLNKDGTILIRAWLCAPGKPKPKNVVGFSLGNCRNGQLITIDVHPDFRRQRLGQQLLDILLQFMKQKGCTRIFSNVALNNLPSVHLHIKAGFKIKKIVPNYYADGTSAYLLVLNWENNDI